MYAYLLGPLTLLSHWKTLLHLFLCLGLPLAVLHANRFCFVPSSQLAVPFRVFCKVKAQDLQKREESDFPDFFFLIDFYSLYVFEYFFSLYILVLA